MSANTQEEILSGILPKVIISKVTIANAAADSSEEQKFLKVDINLIIKETLDKNQFGSWFNDVNIARFIKVQVVQSVNPIVTDILSFSNDMIQLVPLLGKSNFTGTSFKNDTRIKAASYISQVGNLNQIAKLINDNIQTHSISLSTNNSIENYSAHQNSDGNLIYEIPYTLTFEDVPSNIEHLAYFAVSRIDFEALCREFHIDMDVAVSNEENGRVASEVVIDKFNVVDFSYIYIDKNGETWDGAVHLDQNGNWKSGDDETASSIPLTQIIVNNNKVQDFRNIQEIKKIIYNFNQELTGSIQKFQEVSKIQSLDLKLSNNIPVFSDLFLTRDSNNFVKYIFAIDFNNAIRQFSPLGKLFDSKNGRFKQEIIESSRILNLKITKRRIKNNINKAEDLAQFEVQEFEDSRLNYPLIESKDLNVWKTFISSGNSNSLLKEVNVFTKTNTNLAPYSIRYFSGTDMEFSLSDSEGLYQYGVELQVQDGTIEYVSNKINLLKDGKRTLLEYYNAICTPTMKKFLLETDEPHIETNKNNSVNPEIISHGYDILANKISDDLAQRLERRYRPSSSSPWVTQSAIYVDILDIFSQRTITEDDRNRYISILQTYLNPRSANPSSVLKVIELYDELISSLSKLIKINPDSGLNNSLEQSSASEREAKIFKISNMFKNIIDSSVIKRYGVDFLSYSKEQNSSREILYLGNKEFGIRITNENKKYYTSYPSMTVDINNRLVNLQNLSAIDELSFLSPTRFDFPDKSIYVSPFDEDTEGLMTSYENPRNSIKSLYSGDIHENISSLLSDILEIKLSNIGNNPRGNIYSVENNIFRLSNRQRIIEELKEMYSLYGSMIINTFNINENQGTSTPIIDRERRFSTTAPSDLSEPREQQNAESLLYFLSNMAYFNTKYQNASFKYTNNFLDDRSSLFSYVIQDPIKYLIKNQFLNMWTDKTAFDSILTLPVQLKALVLKSDSFISLLLESRDYSEFNKLLKNRLLNYLYFENMMRIEYLDSFMFENEGDINSAFQEEFNIKNANWKTLTRERYNSIGPQNNILCRLTGYANSYFKIKTDKDVEETAYNKYFLLQGSSPDSTGPRLTSNPVPRRSGAIQNQSGQTPENNMLDGMLDSNIAKEIINNIKDAFPNAGLKQFGTNLNNIKNIPKMIEIATTDQKGEKNITNFDILPPSPKETKKAPAKVNSKSAEILMQSITQNSQSSSVKATSISNNIVPNMSIKFMNNKQLKGRKQ